MTRPYLGRIGTIAHTNFTRLKVDWRTDMVVQEFKQLSTGEVWGYARQRDNNVRGFYAVVPMIPNKPASHGLMIHGEVVCVGVDQWIMADTYEKANQSCIDDLDRWRTAHEWTYGAPHMLESGASTNWRNWFPLHAPGESMATIAKAIPRLANLRRDWSAQVSVYHAMEAWLEYLLEERARLIAQLPVNPNESEIVKRHLVNDYAVERRQLFDLEQELINSDCYALLEARHADIMRGGLGTDDPAIVREVLKERLEYAARDKLASLQSFTAPDNLPGKCDQRKTAIAQVKLLLHVGLGALDKAVDTATLQSAYDGHEFSIAALRATNTPVWFVDGHRIESITGAGESTYTWNVPHGAERQDGRVHLPSFLRVDDQHNRRLKSLKVESIVDIDTAGSSNHPIIMLGKKTNRKGVVDLAWDDMFPRSGDYLLRLRAFNECGGSDLQLKLKIIVSA